MPFETFDRRAAHRGGRGEPSARIDSKGNLLILNAAAARLVDGVTHVQLLYDREQQVIGLRPTGAEDLNGFSVGRVPSGANVSVRAFVRAFGIPVGRRFPLEQDGDLFVARVSDAA